MTQRLTVGSHRSLFAGIMLLAIVLRLEAFSMFDVVHYDEVMQYLEQAHRIVFGYGLVPWETRYAIRNNLMPDLLALPMAAGAMISTQHWLPLIAARTVFALLCLGSVPAAYAIGSVRSRLHGLVAMFVAAVWYEAVMFGVQVFSESVAAAFALIGTAGLLRAKESSRSAMLAGFALAFAVLLRMQYVAYAGTVVVLMVGTDIATWRKVLLGALPALALSIAADVTAGVLPFSWVWNSYHMNLGAGRANWFGTSDSFQYLRDINVRLLPAAIPVTAAAFVSGRQYRPVLIAAIANILVHSLIAHKEYRFVWLSVLLIVILAALGTVELVNRLMERREGAQQRALAGLALCGGWGALSIASFNLTGGFETFRGGGYLTRTAIAAAEIPQTCGIALASRDRSHIANVYLPRRVALYLLPDAVIYGNKTFPAEVTGASNAIIMPGDRKSPPGYTQLSCQSEGEHKACLFWRKDGCHNLPAARGYTYQAVMAKDDM